MAGNRLPGFYVQRIRNRRFKAAFKDTGMNQVAVLKVRFLDLLPIDEGSVQAAQVVQQNGVAGEIGETGMMAGDTGVLLSRFANRGKAAVGGPSFGARTNLSEVGEIKPPRHQERQGKRATTVSLWISDIC